MVKAKKVMLIPNNVQKTKMFQYAGASRFAYNWALAREIEEKVCSFFIKCLHGTKERSLFIKSFSGLPQICQEYPEDLRLLYHPVS